MPFMLGDYTDSNGHRTGGFMNGLFGGASSVFQLANNYLSLKERLRLNATGDNIENALKSGAGANDAGTGGLYGTPSVEGAGSTGDFSRPDYETFDDDPELSKLPKIAKKVASALQGFTSSSSEGKGIYGRGQPGTPDSPHDGKDARGASSTNDATRYDTTRGLDWLGQLGQKVRDWAQGYDYTAPPPRNAPQQQPPAPPTYLPPSKPANVGPAGAGGGAGPGTLDTLQQHGALMMPGMAPGGVPYAGAPGLANQQSPLAALMAPYNPTGSVT
jgi:hypothetical protein